MADRGFDVWLIQLTDAIRSTPARRRGCYVGLLGDVFTKTTIEDEIAESISVSFCLHRYSSSHSDCAGMGRTVRVQRDGSVGDLCGITFG